jgi:hypothetical protein
MKKWDLFAKIYSEKIALKISGEQKQKLTNY